MATPSIKEIYKGYEIRKRSGSMDGYTNYFYIALNGERISQMCLGSERGCRNVIDVHIRAISHNQKPIYK